MLDQTVPAAIDWTAVILAIIAILGSGGVGVAVSKVTALLWGELVSKPRADLETLKKQLAAKDDIVATNSAAFDRVAETNERMLGLVGEMVTAWERSQRDSRELTEEVRDLIDTIQRPPGGGGGSAGGPSRTPPRRRRNRPPPTGTSRPATTG